LACNQDVDFDNRNYKSTLELGGLTLGQEYYIQVQGKFGFEVEFCIEVETAQPQPNDNLCNAIALNLDTPCSGPNGSNFGASVEPNEPTGSCFIGTPNSVWYKFTAPNSGGVKISTNNPTTSTAADTEIALYELGGNCADLSTLSELTCNQNASGTIQSTIYISELLAGQEYYIQVSGWNGWEGDFCLEVSSFPSYPNDNLCDAIQLSLNSSCLFPNGNNIGASAEPNEPIASCFSGGVNSVWYKFRSPSSGAVRISTDNLASPLAADTEIALYELNGNCSNPGALSLLACNQDIDSGVNNRSTIIIAGLHSSQEYYVQVSGRNGWEGDFCLGLTDLTEEGADDELVIYVNQQALGEDNGLSWSNAFTSLQDALSFARSLPRATKPAIWVKSGIYLPDNVQRDSSFSLLENMRLYGGFAGTEQLKEERVLGTDSFFVNETILSGDLGVPNDVTDNSLSVVKAYDAGDGIIYIDGVTISGGNADDTSTNDKKSGGGLDII
ncbi:MAG: hypothetical protein AAFN81_34380, partial [Bacteroidota bacterium]